MPSDEDLRAYAQTLPPIYREILVAFSRIEPGRKAGFGLAFQTLSADFENRKLSFGLGEIIKACEQLQEHGIVEIKHRFFVHPTDYGERLIAVITGRQPQVVEVPVLLTPPA